MRKWQMSVAAVALVMTGAAGAQYVERTYRDGSVWQITYGKTKPGQFNAFMKGYRDFAIPSYEEGKKAGDILDYKLLVVQNTRNDEPNVISMIEFKNHSWLDRPDEFFEAMNRRLAGSLEARAQQAAQQRNFYETRGSLLAREMTFNLR